MLLLVIVIVRVRVRAIIIVIVRVRVTVMAMAMAMVMVTYSLPNLNVFSLLGIGTMFFKQSWFPCGLLCFAVISFCYYCIIYWFLENLSQVWDMRKIPCRMCMNSFLQSHDMSLELESFLQSIQKP